ncbi:MAG: TonB-dependent receptor [Bacteroidota bacterium]|nr:TonB-dependent receptor [Bacteroidota bacterium]
MRFFKISLVWTSIFVSFVSFSFAQESENVLDESMKIGSLKADDDLEGDNLLSISAFAPSTCLNTPVSVSLVNERLDDGLQLIAKKTGIKFLYNDALVENLTVNCGCHAQPLKEVLDIVLADKGISYKEFKNGQIVLFKSAPVAEKNGILKGEVKDEKGEPLFGATIIVSGTHYGATTDLTGKFTIKNLKPGNYTIVASFVSYQSVEKKVTIHDGKTIDIDFVLKPTAFQIGGIEVVGKTELLPTDVSTKTTISSGEIEHYQASSIKDVLDLVPGVQMKDNPGIGKTGMVAIRQVSKNGAESDYASTLGTLVVVDGAPVSNNANMQFEKSTGSNTGGSNVGGGIDLRTIPADNIESIEIVTGLPSVRYGDVTEGLINIKTKIGYQPNRLKIKQNPDTKEANLGGGFALGTDGLNYNVNYARSERDIRKTGDEFARLTGQIIYSQVIDDLTINHKFSGQQIFDDEAPKGDAFQTKNYNKSFSLGYNNWGKYNISENSSSLEYNLWLNYRHENSMKSKLVQSDLRILPNGDTVGAYIGKVETRGREWNVGGRLEWNKVLFTGDVVHKVLCGTDLQYNANTGDGVVVDSVFNYYGMESGRRSYSFKDIPGQALASIYSEDKMTWHYGFDFNLMLGFRYEMYRPFEFNAKGLWGDGDLVRSHQGSFFNPRMNMLIYFSKVNQLRLSAGTSSKSPAMSYLYQRPDVFLWRNPDNNHNYYFSFDRTAPNLKGYRETQYEIAYDHKLFDFIGTSITAYYKDRKDENETQTVPIYYVSNTNNKTTAYYVNYSSVYGNYGRTLTKGLEFTLRSNRIKPLNMNFEVNGAYSFSNASTGTLKYDSQPEAVKGQIPNGKVPGVQDTLIGFWYPDGSQWSDRFQLNYYLKYTLPALGLWVTLRAEQVVFERNQDNTLEPEDYNLLTADGKINYDFQRSIKRKEAKWLFNINISKSLFKGAEVSFYVNNLFDDPAIRRNYSSPATYTEEIRNPSLFYGIEFSCIVDELFTGGKD